MIDMVAWPRSYSIEPFSSADSPIGAIMAIAAAAPATWPAPFHTPDSASSCARSVTTTKSQRCLFLADGVRRAASRMASRSSSARGRSSKERTFLRERMASKVSIRRT
jgi:hypothetical protein